MSEYNFEPDYEAWWSDKNITRKQMMCLTFGLNPRTVEAYFHTPRSEYNQEYLNMCDALAGHVSKSSYKDIESVYQAATEYCDTDIWGDQENINRKEFVKNLYLGKVCSAITSSHHGRFEISPHQGFINFLKGKNLWPSMYDEYFNWSLYDYDYSKAETPTTQNSAIGFILGLEPEYLTKAIALYKRSKDTRTYSDEEQAFSRQYIKYIYNKFNGTTISNISSSIDKISNLVQWRNDFSHYVLSLHEEGVIFADGVYAHLKGKNIEPKYTPDGWAMRFYRDWVDKGLWSLEEASALYRGSNPEGGRGFIGFATDEKGLGKKLTMCGYYCTSNDKKFEKIHEFVQNHIDAGNLEACGSEEKFKPEEITNFFLKHFPRNYKPQALLDVLGIANCPEGDVLTHSGLPGRPNSKQLYMSELKKRAENNQLESSVRKQGHVLSAWLKESHPTFPQSGAKAIENAIRDEYRALKKA